MNKVHINKLPDLGARLPDDCEDPEEMEQLKMEVYGKVEIAPHNMIADIIKTIRDPEEPGTLEEL